MASPVPIGARRTDNGMSYPAENLHLLRLGEDASRELPREDMTPEEILADPVLVSRLKLNEMAESLARDGQILPGAVRMEGDGCGSLVDGRRRFLGTWIVNRDPSAFLDKGGKPLAAPLAFRFVKLAVGDDEALELSLISNLQRLDLDLVDRAHTAQRAVNKYGWTQARIAQVMGYRAQGSVSNLLAIAKMPFSVKSLIKDGKFDASSVVKYMAKLSDKELNKLANEVQQGAAPRDIIERLKEKKRSRGETISRSRADLARALVVVNSGRCKKLACWLAGDDIDLSDIMSDGEFLLTDQPIGEFVEIGGNKVRVHEEVQ